MTKLEWSKAGQRSVDPARVMDVGDYGILPDRLAGRKGNPVKSAFKLPNKKKKQKLPVPVKAKPNSRSGKRAKIGIEKRAAGSNNGLTIADKVARAKARVQKINAEIDKTKRVLASLFLNLQMAEREVAVAEDSTRRTVLGKALHEAEKQKRATKDKTS